MIVWITGGGTGIGRAIAEAFFQRGAKILITGRRADVLDRAAREISGMPGGGEILPVAGDASDPDHIQRVIETAKSRWGSITHLINNAGSNFNHPIAEARPDEYRQAFENNTMSVIRSTDAVLPAMRAEGRGTIVNISSVYGRWGTATSASYSVSKFALTGYSEALQQELMGSGIHVLTVFPGFIRTAMTNPFVQPGSVRERLGKSPAAMAQAIMKALDTNTRDLYFPWYVSFVLRLHRWMPGWADRLARSVKR